LPRYTSQIRCPGCRLIPSRCLCEKLPRVRLPWRLLVLQHLKEGRKPTNTARLLVRVVEDSSIVTVAKPERPWTPRLLEPVPGLLEPASEQCVLLFPSPGATLLDRAQLAEWSARPTCVVLVDGSWRQAGRIARRAEGLAELPHVTLPPGPPSRWAIRRAPRGDQLCTFEALVRLVELGARGGDAALQEAARELERAFQLVLSAQQVDAVARA
jgi:DTW domain-containing protein YfiP